MDITHNRERAGCQHLFEAVFRAKPQVHCFGHIHEGRGAKVATWRKSFNSTHFSAIDHTKSRLIEKLISVQLSNFDDQEEAQQKTKRIERYNQDRCCKTSHCQGDENPLQFGRQTLFVKTALCDREALGQKPWLVTIELPRTKYWETDGIL